MYMCLGYFCGVNLAGLGGCRGAQTTQAVLCNLDVSLRACAADFPGRYVLLTLQ